MTMKQTLRALVTLTLAVAAFVWLRDRFEAPPPRSVRETPASGLPTSRAALDARIAEMRRRVAADPADGAAATMLADALMRAARVHADASLPLEAERALRATLRHGEDYAAQQMLAAVYLSQHRFREGLEIALHARKAHPRDAWNAAVAGDALLELGRYDEAFDMFDEAVSLRPDAGAYARVAYARELRGDLRGALKVMRMAAEATASPDVEAQAWVRTQIGMLHLHLAEFDDAEREFRRAEFLFPEHPYALTGRIRLAIARGQHAEALRMLRRAPATPETLAMRGDLQAHLGDRTAAAASYQESERLEREGWASEQPQPGALARFLAERDRSIPEAVALAERAAADRQDIHTMDAMAWAYFKAGRLADADAAIGRAMRTGTVDPRIRCHAAAIAEARRGGAPGRCDPLNPQA